MNLGVLEVCDRELYDPDKNRAAKNHGPLDGRMGISSKTGYCETCEQNLDACGGHFGHVRLALPAFHVGYFKMIITILQEICKACTFLFYDELWTNLDTPLGLFASASFGRREKNLPSSPASTKY